MDDRERDGSEALGAVAERARAEAFHELTLVLRHDLAAIAHVAQSLRERCTRGDIATGVRRLETALARIEQLRATLDAYGGRGTTPVTLARAQHAIGELLSKRSAARGGGRVEIVLDPRVAELPLALSPGALSLAVVELADALVPATPDAPPAARDAVWLWPAEDDARACVAIARPAWRGAVRRGWAVDWVARVLRSHGGELAGPRSLPLPAGASPDAPTAPAFLLRDVAPPRGVP